MRLGGFTCNGSYICGITGQGAQYLSTVMVAAIGEDGSPGAWQTTSSMQQARQEFGLLALNSQLYAIGGLNTNAGVVTPLSSVEVVGIGARGALSGWRYAPPMPEGRMDFGAAAAGHQLFAIAGGQLTKQYDSVLYADTQNFTCEQAIASGQISQCYYGPDGTQYGLTANTDTWDNQKTLAESLGGSLVTIRSADENAAILAALATAQNVWIGFYYDTNDNEWAWQDGSTASYTNWGPGEPNNRTSEHCAEMFGNNRSSFWHVEQPALFAFRPAGDHPVAIGGSPLAEWRSNRGSTANCLGYRGSGLQGDEQFVKAFKRRGHAVFHAHIDHGLKVIEGRIGHHARYQRAPGFVIKADIPIGLRQLGVYHAGFIAETIVRGVILGWADGLVIGEAPIFGAVRVHHGIMPMATLAEIH